MTDDFVLLVGQRIRVMNHDYEFEGYIIARYKKRDGKIRYVIEDDRGLNLIQSQKNLEPMT